MGPPTVGSEAPPNQRLEGDAVTVLSPAAASTKTDNLSEIP